ncbi:hypothetical protein GB931_18200 [Modestobacter sp. I12A-02628]|uniref:Uncharacterized protein n=1 Tax=Goekera deserti TaxID=2497753 RepID=A0A7K3W7V2_9ACTN|nr:hypothetical protein [Goekera deserti]MPQ99814.1 hypothetical protein [Goekera deserti]NDI49971.1 hypothetical protein [Goekera deserti]NEL52552.1 hypothetical protein [Goekera deserti]
MRWTQLFEDLEAQFEAEEDAAARAELPSRVRAEHGRLLLRDRLGGAVGTPLVLGCRGAGSVGGTLVEVGVDWLLVVDDARREVLVSLSAVRAVAGLGAGTAVPADGGEVRRRLDLRRALRGLARDRQPLSVVLDDGTVLDGTLDRVGADFVELAEHHLDEPRRRDAVRGVRAVVLDAVVLARSATPGRG